MSPIRPENFAFRLDLSTSGLGELAMQALPMIAAAALVLSGAGVAVAANPSRIAEAGGTLLGSAYRCGVAEERVVRAGRVMRELIVAASTNAGEQAAATSRLAARFRAAARPDGHAASPACQAVSTQLERIEELRNSPGLPTGLSRP